MNNEEVIKRFLEFKDAKTKKRYITNGYYQYEGCTLSTNRVNTDTLQLINYSTPIAMIKNNVLFINKDKYSRTTSTIQHQLKYLADQLNMAYKETTETGIYKINQEGGVK